VKQYQRKVDAKAISLDEIDTTAAWRAECEEPVMEVAPDWLEDDHATDSDHGETHTVSEDLDEHVPVPEEFHTDSGSVPQSELEGDRPGGSTGTSTGRGAGAAGLHPRPSHSSGHQFRPPSPVSRGRHFAGSSFRGRQSPVRGPQASRAPTSSSRGKAICTAITFSRKRGRGNQ